MRTEKQRKEAREKMKVYLSNPVRREMHNAFSSRWYHVTVKGDAKKLAKHRENVARAFNKYKQNNRLSVLMYSQLYSYFGKEES